jgi:hypothetical protein
LAWGSTATTSPESELTATAQSTTSSGTASIDLTDVMGQRTVRVEAKVTIAAQDYPVTQNVTFGAGPLAAFAGPPVASGTSWLAAVDSCGGDSSTVNLSPPEYKPDSHLPQVDTLEKVAKSTGKGAAYAAGWDTVAATYWTGEIASAADAYYVILSDGVKFSYNIWYYTVGAVCLP